MIALDIMTNWQQRKKQLSLFYFLIFVWLLSETGTKGFVKQLLKRPPVIERTSNTYWRRIKNDIAVYANFTLTLTKSLEVPTPSYLQILEDDTLSVTSFSLLRKGSIMQFDLFGINKPRTFHGDFLWPNELSTMKDRKGISTLLVPDGFLMPGQSDGGIIAIQDYQHPAAHPIRLTAPKEGWFYHRATYLKLPGGSEGILTARATKPLFGEGYGELIWLVLPSGPSSIQDLQSGEYLEEIVLAQGPDVMFEVFDYNPDDSTIEVIAAHFFSRKLSIHSLRSLEQFPFVEVTKSSVIDTIGRPYGLSFATFHNNGAPSNRGNDIESPYSAVDLAASSTSVSSRTRKRAADRDKKPSLPRTLRPQDHASRPCQSSNTFPTHILVTTHECNYDISSAIDMAFNTIQGDYPKVKTRDFTVVGNHHAASPTQHRFSQQDASSESTSNTNSLMQHKVHLGEAISSRTHSSVAAKSTASTSFGQEHDPDAPDTVSGGSLFAYEIPLSHFDESSSSSSSSSNSDSAHLSRHRASKPPPAESSLSSTVSADLEPSSYPSLHNWRRSTLFRGFKVRGWGGIFSPGAPGFPYVFRLPNKADSPPLILLAGDCTGSAYVFAPCSPAPSSSSTTSSMEQDTSTAVPRYELAFEVECGATVGSAAVASVSDGSGDVNLFIPAYELNKIHVFRLSAVDAP